LARVLAVASGGVDHIVESAFDANIATDARLLAQGGSISAYATVGADPAIPFWPLLFKGARVFFLGSDDFPPEAKAAAARALADALAAGWEGFEIAHRIPLSDIVKAHELMEQRGRRGRIVLVI
jgi:NADPH2:quinone reductase